MFNDQRKTENHTNGWHNLMQTLKGVWENFEVYVNPSLGYYMGLIQYFWIVLISFKSLDQVPPMNTNVYASTNLISHFQI